jgi:hypothetical protein
MRAVLLYFGKVYKNSFMNMFSKLFLPFFFASFSRLLMSGSLCRTYHFPLRLLAAQNFILFGRINAENANSK